MKTKNLDGEIETQKAEAPGKEPPACVKTKNLDGEIETGRGEEGWCPCGGVKTKNLDGEIETLYIAAIGSARTLREDQESRWGD